MKQLQADFLAFFGMKLGSENVVAPDCGGKGLAISCTRGNDGAIRWLGKKTVDEIDIAAGRNASKDRTSWLLDINLIPTDLRDLQSVSIRKSDDVAFE